MYLSELEGEIEEAIVGTIDTLADMDGVDACTAVGAGIEKDGDGNGEGDGTNDVIDGASTTVGYREG